MILVKRNLIQIEIIKFFAQNYALIGKEKEIGKKGIMNFIKSQKEKEKERSMKMILIIESRE